MNEIAKILTVLLMAGVAGGYRPACAAETTALAPPGEAIAATELGAQAGGEDLTLNMGDLNVLHNNLNQTANAASNVLQGTTSTGTNYVTDNAFQSAAGIVNLIQNTGNQVVIQNATNMNVFLK